MLESRGLIFNCCISFIMIISFVHATNIFNVHELDRSVFPKAKSEYNYFESMVPSLTYRPSHTESTIQDVFAKEATVVFSAFNKNFTLDLIKNSVFLPKTYTETHVHAFNKSYVKSPSLEQLRENSCYYHGTLRGIPNSYAAISTCYGISGMFSDGHTSYHIQPSLYNQLKAVHYIYRDSDRKKTHNLTCGVDRHTNKHPYRFIHHRLKRAIHPPATSKYSTRYIEMYLVVDNKLYRKLNSDSNRAFHRCKEIINIVSKLYKPLNIYVVLVGAEIWKHRDQITVETDSERTMTNFLYYRRLRINPKHRNDNAQLLTGTRFNNNVLGKAPKGPICTFKSSGGVNADTSLLVGTIATTVAHELGHNLGMSHDNNTCQCVDDKCIMAVTTSEPHITHWSSCSVTSLTDAFISGMDYCLKNVPDIIFQGPVCGNGFTEEGEQCDCGLRDACDNKCCNSSTCQLSPHAECATGKCCDLSTCRVRSKGFACRSSQGQCDLPEYCNGKNEFCPLDFYKIDGTLCDSDKAYCYQGQCPSYDAQCKLLWGSSGRQSDATCYKTLNSNGSENGNCGFDPVNETYVKCKSEDVMCGLLHCIHLNEKLVFWHNAYAHHLPVSFITKSHISPTTRRVEKYICRGAILDVGLDMPDPGLVPEGAKCGDEKICVSQRCRPLSAVQGKVVLSEACLQKCYGHGVCNNDGNCHCDAGYKAPDCKYSGLGGSVDSNPANQPIAKDGEYSHTTLVICMVVFLVILPIIALAVFCAYRCRKNLGHWWNSQQSLKYRFSNFLKSPPSDSTRKGSATNVPLNNPPTSNTSNSLSVRFAPPPKISNPILRSSTNRDSKAYIGVSQGNSREHVDSPDTSYSLTTSSEPSSDSDPTNTNTSANVSKPGVYMNVPTRPPARPPPPRPKSSYDTGDTKAKNIPAARTSSLRNEFSQLSEVTVHNDNSNNSNTQRIKDPTPEHKSREASRDVITSWKKPTYSTKNTAKDTQNFVNSPNKTDSYGPSSGNVEQNSAKMRNKSFANSSDDGSGSNLPPIYKNNLQQTRATNGYKGGVPASKADTPQHEVSPQTRDMKQSLNSARSALRPPQNKNSPQVTNGNGIKGIDGDIGVRLKQDVGQLKKSPGTSTTDRSDNARAKFDNTKANSDNPRVNSHNTRGNTDNASANSDNTRANSEKNQGKRIDLLKDQLKDKIKTDISPQSSYNGDVNKQQQQGDKSTGNNFKKPKPLPKPKISM